MSWLEVAGRLKPGVSLANARADLAVIAAGVDRQNPGRKTTLLVDTATFMNNPEGRGPVLGVGAMILAAVSLVLVIACANLANLLLARAVGRKKEIAVRLAVGASRWRLLRQLLTESLLLSTAGGVLGLLAAWATLRTMVPLLMARLPQEVQSITLNPDPDIRIVLYSLALAFATGIGFGLLPALQGSNPDLNSALKDSGTSTGGRSAGWLRNSLVTAQIAVCLVLLIAAGLLVRGLQSAQAIDPGFETRGIATAGFDLSLRGLRRTKGRRISSPARRAPLRPPRHPRRRVYRFRPAERFAPRHHGHARRQIGQAPDHQRRDLRQLLPTPRHSHRPRPRLRPARKQFGPTRHHRQRVHRAQILARRRSHRQARAQCRTTSVSASDRRLQRHTRHRTRSRGPCLHLLCRRTAHPSRPVAAGPRRRAAYPPSPKPFARKRRHSIPTCWSSRDRSKTTSRSSNFPRAFCPFWPSPSVSAGLLLASLGIYGVMAYAVTQRTSEIGIRMTMGAQRRDVMQLILAQSMRPVAVGVALGLGASAGISRVLTQPPLRREPARSLSSSSAWRYSSRPSPAWQAISPPSEPPASTR